MTVGGIEAPTGLGFSAGLPGLGGVSASSTTEGPTGPQGVSTGSTTGAAGIDFKSTLAGSIEGLEAMHDSTDRLAVQAATGDLGAIHQYTLAATEMSVATQLTVAVRNKAVEAFNEIMRMQV